MAVVHYSQVVHPKDTHTMTAAPTAQGTYFFAERLDLQGTPAGDFYVVYLRGLTHKLNNLLAVFQGFSSLLLMNDGLDASGKESVNHMKAAAQNGQALSERIVASGGCARLTTQKMALADYLPMIDRTLREPFQKLGVPFEIRADSNLPMIDVDSARLKEILVEMLKNAAEAAKEAGGDASMEIYGPGRSPEGTFDRVDIFIHNSGVIRPDKFGEIYKPFVSTKDGSHFGLGLTLAAMLAHQMNMTLGAKCEGNRTTFWLSIPVAH